MKFALSGLFVEKSRIRFIVHPYSTRHGTFGMKKNPVGL